MMSWDFEIALWDEVFYRIRKYFRGRGIREVSTPVRVPAPAIEPYIEPLFAGPFSGFQNAASPNTKLQSFLATSPELSMKRMLCRGSGSIFQIAQVFRAGEFGPKHREEFHLIEWYRVGGDLRSMARDVENLIECTVGAVEQVRAVFAANAPGGETKNRSGAVAGLPKFRVESCIRRMSKDLGASLLGDESADELQDLLRGVREQAAIPFDSPDASHAEIAQSSSAELASLIAWTELFSLWSDLYLDPWLDQLVSKGDGHGVHLNEFPASLAALARTEGSLAFRQESYGYGFELANAYWELRDAEEQSRRFQRVSAWRSAAGLPALPQPAAFLADLESPGLPDCVGAAMGLDRLLAVALGRPEIHSLAPWFLPQSS